MAGAILDCLATPLDDINRLTQLRLKLCKEEANATHGDEKDDKANLSQVE